MHTAKKILAVIDPEQDKQSSLSRAMELAQKSQASITAFLGIYDFSYDMTTMLSVDERDTMRKAVIGERTEWLKKLVSEQCKQQDHLQIDVKVMWHNRAWEAVIEQITEHQYDLVVKGTRQHNGLKSMIFTPTDWHLLRKAPVPVLLVKEHDWPSNGQIIAAVNLGVEDKNHQSLNERVTDTAKSCAELLNANVNLVNAYPGTPVNIAIELPEFDPSAHNASVKRHHESAMQSFGQKHNIDEKHCYVREGMPEDAIPALAEELDAELVIIGTVGRQGLSAALIGNTAEHVIDNLNCDVLAIKPEGFS